MFITRILIAAGIAFGLRMIIRDDVQYFISCGLAGIIMGALLNNNTNKE